MQIHDNIPNTPSPIKFKGHTCIELFNAKTGERILKQEDDNTYNARLQAYGYYLLFFANKGATATNIQYTGSTIPAYNTADTSAYPGVLGIPSFQRNGALTAATTGTFSNFFNSMLLTTSTTTQSSTGRPSGYLVGWADVRTYAASYNDYYEQGILNLNESYITDTNLHIVVDFDEYHGNTSFDAIWLYPGRVAATVGGHHSYRYFGYEETGTSIPQLNTLVTGILDIDGRRRLFVYSSASNNGPGRGTEFAILDTFEGVWEGTYSFPALTTVGQRIHYDATNKILYGLVDGASSANVSATKSTWWKTSTAENTRPFIVATNFETQTQTEIIDLRAFVDLEPADFGYIGTNGANWAVGYSGTGGAYLFLQVMGHTNTTNTAGSISLLVYRFNTNTLDFSYVGTISNLASSILSPTINSSLFTASTDVAMIGNTLVIGAGLLGNTSSVTNTATYFDLANLSVITDTAVRPTNGTAGNFYSNYGFLERVTIISPTSTAVVGSVMNGSRAWLDHDGPIYCANDAPNGLYLTSRGVGTGISAISQTVRKYYYSDAFWTTHNKLTAPITKTAANTMRITYDITLDSLPGTMWMNMK